MQKLDIVQIRLAECKARSEALAECREYCLVDIHMPELPPID